MTDILVKITAAILAFVLFASFIVGFLLLAMLCWGFVFMAFDWVFPGVIVGVVPDPLNTYTPFTIGAMFGFIVVLVRSVLSNR